MRRSLWIAVVLAGLSPACHRPGTHAVGSGYGVGIPRQAFTFGNEPQTRGIDTCGVDAPTEAYVGRIRRAPEVSSPQAGRFP
jgi:hypothetical protein